AGLATSDRQQHDRLRGSGGCTSERAPVAEVLHVQRDQPRRLVAGEALDELRCLEIRLVAERREAREAEPFALRQQRELQRQVAALRDQPDRARREIDPRPGTELGIALEDAE